MAARFLSLARVLKIHENQIALYGGEVGIRDMGLLLSALATPRATFDGQFLHADLFEMASAYLFHIAQNHPFVDGNKRTAFVVANVFLIMNGYEIVALSETVVDFVLALARGERSKANAADFLRKFARPIPNH